MKSSGLDNRLFNYEQYQNNMIDIHVYVNVENVTEAKY
jgi:hypothetical protein